MPNTTISNRPDAHPAPGARDLPTTLAPAPRPIGRLASVTLACPVTDRCMARLTPRQRQIMDLVAQGLTNAGIASRLHLAEKSVENQLTAIYTEMGVHGGTVDQPVHPRVTAALTYLLQLHGGRSARPLALAA